MCDMELEHCGCRIFLLPGLCKRSLFRQKPCCALAVMCFNDGASSLTSISSALKLKPTAMVSRFLSHKNILRIKNIVYGSSERANKLRKYRGRKKKGLENLHT